VFLSVFGCVGVSVMKKRVINALSVNVMRSDVGEGVMRSDVGEGVMRNVFQ
jgi:hypothetical protein